MKQTKHEYAIEKIQELTEKYNLPKLDCLDCIHANFGKCGCFDYNTFFCHSTEALENWNIRSLIAESRRNEYPKGQKIWWVAFLCEHKLKMWLFHEFKQVNKENPRVCNKWMFRTKNTLKYVEVSSYYADNHLDCRSKISSFERSQLDLQSIEPFSQEMSDFLKKAPKIRIPNNPLKLGVLL